MALRTDRVACPDHGTPRAGIQKVTAAECTVGGLCDGLARLAAASRFFAATGSRFRAESARAGTFVAGAAARVWDADATLDLAVFSRSFTPLVPASYPSMTAPNKDRSEEHTSELQSLRHL